MKVKNERLETLRRIISTRQLGSQEELLSELQQEGFTLTQATLSRDLKQLKVAKASTLSGNYVYVLPNETMYRRVSVNAERHHEGRITGYLSINFSGNMGVIKTRPGYASAIAWDIDNSSLPCILGTIAGDDTIFIVINEDASHQQVTEALAGIFKNIAD